MTTVLVVAAVWLGASLAATSLWGAFRRPARGDGPGRDLSAPTPCGQRTCQRVAVITVTNRATGDQTRVCPGCYDRGTAWGWWA